jgi:hypothetical protein
VATEERKGARTIARECALLFLFGLEAWGV